MNYDFANFDKNFDHESLKNDYVEARKRKVHFPKIPDGCYEVSVKRMELKFSKKGDPMLAIQFEILEGEFEGLMIFVNQVVTSGFGILDANRLLRGMAPREDIEWCNSFSLYADLINRLFNQIKNSRKYAISYSTTNKGYKNVEIDGVFELES